MHSVRHITASIVSLVVATAVFTHVDSGQAFSLVWHTASISADKQVSLRPGYV